jgi:glyoxylase-like metal-dependent hydrolase (beta-lactamase superfamily II)
VTLVLDTGKAFAGDLTREGFAADADVAAVAASWARVREMSVQTVYPGHGDPFALADQAGHTYARCFSSISSIALAL